MQHSQQISRSKRAILLLAACCLLCDIGGVVPSTLDGVHVHACAAVGARLRACPAWAWVVSVWCLSRRHARRAHLMLTLTLTRVLLGGWHFFPSGRARAPRLRHLHGHGHGAEELEQMADGRRNTWYIIRWHTLGVYTAYCTYSNRVEEGAGRS